MLFFDVLCVFVVYLYKILINFALSIHNVYNPYGEKPRIREFSADRETMLQEKGISSPFLIVFRMEERNDLVYGYEAAARIMQVSPNTVANYIKQGKLEGCYNRVSPRKIVFSREKLERKIWGSI